MGRPKTAPDEVSIHGEAFLEMLVAERNASEHTQRAYRGDVAHYEEFLARKGHAVRDAVSLHAHASPRRAAGVRHVQRYLLAAL